MGWKRVLKDFIKWEGTLEAFRFQCKSIICGTKTLTTGTYNDVNITDVNTLFIDTSGGNVILNGTTGGVNGQILHIVTHDWSNNTTINHNNAGGTQKFQLHALGAEVMTGEPGGWTFVNHNGGHWHDASHAKHV